QQADLEDEVEDQGRRSRGQEEPGREVHGDEHGHQPEAAGDPAEEVTHVEVAEDGPGDRHEEQQQHGAADEVGGRVDEQGQELHGGTSFHLTWESALSPYRSPVPKASKAVSSGSLR